MKDQVGCTTPLIRRTHWIISQGITFYCIYRCIFSLVCLSLASHKPGDRIIIRSISANIFTSLQWRNAGTAPAPQGRIFVYLLRHCFPEEGHHHILSSLYLGTSLGTQVYFNQPQRLKVRGFSIGSVRPGETDPEVLLNKRHSSLICLSLATRQKAVDGWCCCLILCGPNLYSLRLTPSLCIVLT